MNNKQIILNLLEQNNSFYLYDKKGIEQSVKTLTQNFDGIEFLYSLKTNPNCNVVETIFKNGLGADAASVSEVLISAKNNVPKELILFSAPGKTTQDIANTIEISTLIADSLDEIHRIDSVAKQKNIVVKIGVRLNPPFTFVGNSPIPSKFGIDSDSFFSNLDELKKLEHVEITGIHVHSRSQELDEKVIENYYKKMFSLSREVVEKLGKPLEFINMGSGIGIAYADIDKPCNTEYLGNSMSKLTQQFKNEFSKTTIFIETGRFLVGKNGVYVTKVLDKKVSCGKTFVILCNTLNGFIRPSIEQLVLNYDKTQNPLPVEPLYTSKDAFQFIPLCLQDKGDQIEEVSLVGNLCTAADVVAKDITFPKLQIGDAVVITNAGSYAAVLSPMQFSSQTPPKEFFVYEDGSVK